MGKPHDEAIRGQLDRILSSPGFVNSERLRRFLTYAVDAVLEDRLDSLKEYSIGVAVFDRPKHYNPAEDPIVRVEARRLRRKLGEYYQANPQDPVVIDVPKGAYLPAFEIRSKPKTPRRWPLLAGAAVLALGCT